MAARSHTYSPAAVHSQADLKASIATDEVITVRELYPRSHAETEKRYCTIWSRRALAPVHSLSNEACFNRQIMHETTSIAIREHQLMLFDPILDLCALLISLAAARISTSRPVFKIALLKFRSRTASLVGRSYFHRFLRAPHPVLKVLVLALKSCDM